MNERRKEPRSRSYLGAAMVLSNRVSVLSCIVRDISETGARLEFDNAALIPDGFDLTITERPEPFWARTVWRGRDSVGVALTPPSAEMSGEIARRMRAAELERKTLRRRVKALSDGY